ncbi:unnamed protein product [Clonostachys chloroleuca]|uniref:Uncharacterized protein n=1 Tax=Clonostachys chloroleuca TaxID=1926264 RepID=A0AA35LTH2_9HYPO|nr:unnamed protein product [Clonostachys chloroleuca]
MSIGVERCLRPSDEVCLDADGVSYGEAPFSTCSDQDNWGCNGKICNQKIPMGMIIGPGPNSWPRCYNMYHTKWITIPTPGDTLKFLYYQTPENAPGHSMDILIEDLESILLCGDDLPYMILGHEAMEMETSNPIDAGDMDHEVSTIRLVHEFGLKDDYTLTLTCLADGRIWKWILELGPVK